MAQFILYARRFILSLDASDGGDLIRATGHPKKLQFGTFDLEGECKGTIGVVLWGQTCNRQDKELHVTPYLKRELLELAEKGANGGTMVILGVSWRITVHEDVESSDGVSSTMSSLV